MGRDRPRRLAAAAAALAVLPSATAATEPGMAAAASGTATARGPSWTVTPVLGIAGEQVRPQAIAAAPGGDVWAVGYVYTGTEFRTLALRRHHGRWSVVPTPDVETAPAQDFLSGVVAHSSTDVWMVGQSATAIGNLASRPLVEHWDGKTVSIVPVPDPGAGSGLTAVSGVASDLWAVGNGPGIDDPATRLVMHFDGKAWTQIPMPVVVAGCDNRYGANLTSVLRVAPDDVYVGGACTPPSDSSASHGFVGRYHHSTWTAVVSAPGHGSIDGLGASHGTVWAVGWRQATGGGPATSWGVAYWGSGSTFTAFDQKRGRAGTTYTFEGVAPGPGGTQVAVGTATSPQPPFVGFGGFTSTPSGWRVDRVTDPFGGFGRFSSVSTDSSGRILATGFGISSSGDDVGVIGEYRPPT